MGVIVTRKPDPWWAAPLTQLVTGQIDAMMERTQKAKGIEGQRAFAGMLAQLAQQNPDLSETDLYTRAMADPSYSRAGEQGQGMLRQILAAREKERAKQELNSLIGGDDPRNTALRVALAAKANGMDPKDVMPMFAPKLERQETNLGDRVTGRMVNPYTGQAVGDSFTEQIGVDPAVTAKIAYEKGRDALDFGYKTRELATRGFQMVQGADGQWYFVNPATGAVKPSGILAPLKESVAADPAMEMFPKAFGTYAELVAKDSDLNPEAAKQAKTLWDVLLLPTMQRMQGGAAQGASGIPAAGSAAGAGKQTLAEAERKRLLSKGWTPEQIAAEERRRSGM